MFNIGDLIAQKRPLIASLTPEEIESARQEAKKHLYRKHIGMIRMFLNDLTGSWMLRHYTLEERIVEGKLAYELRHKQVFIDIYITDYTYTLFHASVQYN